MQDDTTTSESSSPSSSSTQSEGHGHKALHAYFEVSAELLAKPSILCDLIEAHGNPSTLVFCNSPSDADFVDVMLKKRGIRSRKLIGHVPPQRVSRALEELHNGKCVALVMTDVSAESIVSEKCGLIINHSAPNDPETYLERVSKAAEGPEPVKVVSLVGPLDFSNFHYLRKIVDEEFVKIDPPSAEQIARSRVTALIDDAKKAAGTFDDRSRALATLVLDKSVVDDSARLEITTLLLNSYLSSAASSDTGSSEEDRDGERRDRDRGGRGDRGDRGDRGNRRRGGRRGDYDDSEMNGSGGYDDEMRSEGRRDGRRERRERPRGPAPRDMRFYIGTGSRDGFSQAEFSKLLSESLAGTPHEGIEAPIKRFIDRELYSFADVSEEVGKAALDGLRDATLDSGKQVYVCKATEIPLPRPEESEGAQDHEDDRAERRSGPADFDDDQLAASPSEDEE